MKESMKKIITLSCLMLLLFVCRHGTKVCINRYGIYIEKYSGL